MAAQTHQSINSQEDDELLNEAVTSNYQDLSEYDAAQLGFAFQAIEGVILLKTARFYGFKNAYETLTDPKLAENLLDFEHSENIVTARESLRITERELKKKGNVKRGYTDSRFLFWKSRQITNEQYQRALRAVVLARRLEKKINARSKEIKLENHLTRLGLTAEKLPEVNKRLLEWLDKNKSKTLNDALIADTQRSYKEQGKSLDKKEERQLREELSTSRTQAIEEFKKSGSIERARDVLTQNVINLESPILNRVQLREQEEFILKGKLPQKGELTQQKLAPGFAEIPMDLADEIMGRAPTPQVAPQPIITEIPHQPPPPGGGGRERGGVPNFLANLRSLFSSGKNLLGSLGGSSIGDLGKTLLQQGVKSLGGLLGKQGLKQALGSIIPGIGNLAMLGASAVGKLLESLIGFDPINALVKGAVIIIIGLVIFIVVMPMLGFLGMPNVFPAGTTTIVYNKGGQKSLSWKNFEEKYLVYKEQNKVNQYSWRRFEENYLTLYTNRHDNMKK